jgi:hypothetical protein
MTQSPVPRPPRGRDRPAGSQDRGRTGHLAPAPPFAGPDDGSAPVSLIRTSRGWSVVSPGGAVPVGDLVEGMSLADLVAEEHGGVLEPDRTARRSARGSRDDIGDVADIDPTAARIAALERTVAQLEHALAARVSTERAIGVLAERHGTSPRQAFEVLRREARSGGRPVHELARGVLDGLAAEGCPDAVVLAVAPPRPPDADRAAEGRR